MPPATSPSTFPEDDWPHYVGFVPQLLLDSDPSPENAIAITCGPPIMIKFALPELDKLGFKSEQIYTTLENRMKCGIGKCGRCNVGRNYVCVDGPCSRSSRSRRFPRPSRKHQR